MSMRSLLQPDQIWYGGLVRSEAAMRIMSDIGSKLTHTFQVTNDGPWHVDDFNVLIEWPHRVFSASKDNPQIKWLLYMTDPPEVTPAGIGECFVNPRSVNALGLRDAVRRPPLYTNRRPPKPYLRDKLVISKRSISTAHSNINNVIHSEAVEAAEAVTSKANVVLDCADDGLVQCHIFTCRIHGGLKANESAVIRLRSRVWNSTLVEEFGAAASTVAISAKAHLEIPEELDIHQENLGDDLTVATLLAMPDASLVGDGVGLDTVPTWIILVSVFVGLIVVSLIAATLYKLGFFRRNRVPEDVMISAKVTSATNGNGCRTRVDEYIS